MVKSKNYAGEGGVFLVFPHFKRISRIALGKNCFCFSGICVGAHLSEGAGHVLSGKCQMIFDNGVGKAFRTAMNEPGILSSDLFPP